MFISLEDIQSRSQARNALNNAHTVDNVTKFLVTRQSEIESIEQLASTKMPQYGEQLLIVTSKAFSAFDYVIMMTRRFDKINKMFLSTYNMSEKTVETFIKLIKDEKIEQAKIIINAKFEETKSDREKFEYLETVGRQNEKIKLKFSPNHSKIILLQIKEQYFIWKGSGNAASNAQIEEYSWWQSKDDFLFYANSIIFK